jgi:hypothetical protein
LPVQRQLERLDGAMVTPGVLVSAVRGSGYAEASDKVALLAVADCALTTE